MVTETSTLNAEQARLDSMLLRGIVFSVIWLAGFGSCYALYQGMRARRMLSDNPALEGHGRAIWCIVAGGLGALVLVTFLGIGLFNAVTRP